MFGRELEGSIVRFDVYPAIHCPVRESPADRFDLQPARSSTYAFRTASKSRLSACAGWRDPERVARAIGQALWDRWAKDAAESHRPQDLQNVERQPQEYFMALSGARSRGQCWPKPWSQAARSGVDGREPGAALENRVAHAA